MFEVKISEVSRDLSAKERVMIKDTGNALRLDELTKDGSFVFSPVAFAVLDIHNDQSKDNKDYHNYILLTDGGQKYVTGSGSFWNSFKAIWNEMNGSAEEWAIEVYQKPSKNRPGKTFISCSLV